MVDLESEFKNSGAVRYLQIPDQHKIYGGYPTVSQQFPYQNKKQRSGPLIFKKALEATTISNHPADEYSQKVSKAYCLFLGRKINQCKA